MNRCSVSREESNMKKLLILAGVLGLSGCSVLPLVGAPQVAGNLVGEWPEGSRLALVGVADYSNQQQIVDDNITDGYVFALPDPAAEGSYQVVGYQDTNENSLFDEGEAIGTTGTKYLVYSTVDQELEVAGTPVVVRRGWNGYDSSAVSTEDAPNPFQADTYSNYDLFLN
jgi:hypothetical protein